MRKLFILALFSGAALAQYTPPSGGGGGGAPSGPAGGDLSGTYPTPGVAKLGGVAAASYVQSSVTTLSSLASIGTITTGTWHGSQVALAYGGTAANLTANNGGIFYSTASAGAILAGTATAGLALLSGSSTTPAWSASAPALLGSANTFTSQQSLPDVTSNNLELTVGGVSFLSDYPGTIATNGDVWLGGAGNFTLTGTKNTAVGYQSMSANTSGYNNVAVGYQTLNANTTGQSNTVVGYYSLHSNTTGFGNTIVGEDAAQIMATAQSNTCVGALCLQLTTTGNFNAALGAATLQSNTTGLFNVAIGYDTLNSAKLAADDVAIGGETAQWAVEASNNGSNTAIGVHALYQATNESYNMCLGRASCYNLTTGIGNINIGGFEAAMLVPPDGFTATIAAGSGLSIGTYAYKIAWTLNGNNTELSQLLGGATQVTTTSGNQQVTLASLPAYSGPLTCTQTLIYRTTVGFALGNQRWYLAGTIGNCSGGTYTDSIPDSSLVTEDASPDNTLIMGYHPMTGDQTAYKSDQAVFGSPSNPYTELWLGSGVFTPTSTPVLISASGGSGTNTRGSDLVISGGPGTGSATSGSVVIEAAKAGSSGSLWNAVTNVATFNGMGETVTAMATPAVLTAALPTCTASTGTPWRASVSDATTPVLGTALTGGGAVFSNVHCSLTTGTYIVDGL